MDGHVSPVGFDGAVDHGQPQSRALSHLLGGEEGVQGLLEDLLGHSASSILDDDLDPMVAHVPGH